MKRFLLLLCALIFVLGAAAAAQTDWKGFYVGGNVGAGIGDSDATTSTVFSPTGYFAPSSVPAINTVGVQHPNSTGITGGAQAGYNHQWGRFVAGAEVDFGGLDLGATSTGTATYPCCAPTTFTVRQSVTTGWLFTARPRLGFTAGNFLLYGTGGLALTNLNYQEVFTDTFASAFENGGVKEEKLGWTAGGGAEYQIKTHWSVKAEYLYADFGRVSTTSANLTAFVAHIAFPTNVFTHTADLRTHIVRFGINYRF